MLWSNFLTEENVKNFSWVSRKWVHSKRICFTVSRSPKKHKTVGRHQKVGTSVLCDNDAVYSEVLEECLPRVAVSAVG